MVGQALVKVNAEFGSQRLPADGRLRVTLGEAIPELVMETEMLR
jgi:hypothetical protein